MNHLVTLALLLTLSASSFAQKCKESADPITNEKKVEYEFIYIAGLYMKYEVLNGKATMTKDFTYQGAINGTVPPGVEIIFKLENGDVIKLKSAKEAAPKMYASAYGVSTGYTFQLPLSKDELSKFASSPVILIRIPKITEEGFYDLDAKSVVVKKCKKPIQKGAECISSYL